MPLMTCVVCSCALRRLLHWVLHLGPKLYTLQTLSNPFAEPLEKLYIPYRTGNRLTRCSILVWELVVLEAAFILAVYCLTTGSSNKIGSL